MQASPSEPASEVPARARTRERRDIMSVAIGGDETGGFVGDVGTASSKFGMGGENEPKCVLNSRLGCVFDGATYAKRRGTADDSLPELRELTAEDYELPDDYPA